MALDFSVEIGISILIIIGAFVWNFLFLYIVSARNSEIGYTIFDIWIYLGILAIILVFVINTFVGNTFGAEIPISFSISALIPFVIYLFIIRSRESRLYSKNTGRVTPYRKGYT